MSLRKFAAALSAAWIATACTQLVTPKVGPWKLSLQPVTGGTLSVTPAGSTCSDCGAGTTTFNDAMQITVTAKPDANHTFTGFTGDCTGTSCTLTMEADHAVGAMFAPIPETLTIVTNGPGLVASSPQGIYCGATCTNTFDSGTMVTLTATAGTDAAFAGWGGACSGTDACTISLTQATNVTASFTTQTNSITVTSMGNGHGKIVSTPAGIDCGETCTASFAAGSVVVLSATPDATSTFGGWSGDCSGTGACVVSVDEVHAVTAQFDPAVAALSVVAVGGGTVTSSDNQISCGQTCRATYDVGSMVALTATANSGYTFTGWSGACTGTGPCVVTLSSAQVVAAAFQPTNLAVLDTYLSNGPPNPTSQTSASFWFSGTVSAVSFQCALDGAAPAACTSPATYASVADGSHTFTVAAVDMSGNVDQTPATYRWTIDTHPPVTTITQEPADPSNVKAPTFAFTSSEDGSSFVCGLDGHAPARCTSPVTLPSLPDGMHVFTVTAIDSAGNVDPFPPTYTWTINTQAPAVSLTKTPPNPSNDPAPSFEFTSTEPGSTFACALDGATPAPCTSPAALSDLEMGSHTFSVTATDTAGNVSQPATYTWTVNLVLPTATITSQPANPTNATTATFAFTSSEDGSTFQCQLDTAVYVSCTSPISYPGLGDGAHTFSVIATDPSGNASPAASTTWSIDTSAPVVNVTSQPQNPTKDTSGTFAFTSSKPDCSFVCTIDGTSRSCTSPVSYMGFSSASHTFSVVATDLAGNTSLPATYTWTVDTTPPAASITSGPANPTHIVNPSFSFISNEAGSTFVCQLDSNPASACTSPKQYAGMADGQHIFSVTATDPAGNTSQPATYPWTVDTTALSAPTPISATAGNGQVTISWASVAEAQSYTIYYGTSPAFGSVISGLTGTSHTITGLTDCTTYYFTVTDTNQSGNECGQPAAVTATPAPVAPAVTATGANGSISLNWSSVPGASGYSVYYGTTSGTYNGTNALAGPSPFTVSGTSATLTGLPPYASTYIAVSVTQASCEGPKSTEVVSAPNPWRSLNPGPTNNALRGISCAGGSFPCVALGAQGTALSTTDGVTWTPDYSQTTADLTTVQLVTSQIGYGISGSTVYKTTNGGTSWLATTTISPSQSAVYEVAFANDTTGLVAAPSGNVVKTTDGGKTWTVISTGTLANWYGIYFSTDMSLAITVGQQGVIRRSTDGGNTWAYAPSGVTTDLQSVTCSSATNCWAVGSSGVVLVSTDGGQSWSAQTSGTTGTIHRVAFANNNVGWLVADSGYVAGTTNGGTTWAAQTSGETGTLYGLAVKGPTDVYFSGAGGILRHSSDGSTWNSLRVVLTTNQLNRVHAFDDQNVLIIGNGGYVLKTTNGGATWMTSTPTTKDLLAMAFVDASNGLVVGRSGTILRTVDGGATWSTESSGTTVDLDAVQCLSTTMCWAAGGTYLLSTTDGMTWSSTNLASATQNQGILSIAFSDATHGILGLNDNGSVGWTATNIIRTIDGVFWATSSFDPTGYQGTNGGFGPVPSIYMQDPSHVFVLANSLGWSYQAVAYSSNAGASWSAAYNQRVFNGTQYVDLAVGNGLFAVASLSSSNNNVLMSTNGQNWRNSPTGINSSLRGIAIGNAETLYAVGDNGVILKTVTAGQ